MEGEELMLANGGDGVSTPVGHAPTISNGFPHEKSETLIQEQEHEDEEVLETPKGSDGTGDTIKLLNQEIQGLRRDRSELQRRMEEMLSEMERSEVGTKAVAAHASYLEGELVRTQEDLATASSVAEEAESEAKGLRLTVKTLEADKKALEAKIASKEADLSMEKEQAAILASEKDGEILALKGEVEALEIKGKALKEELMISLEKGKEVMEEEVKRRVSRQEELEKAVKEMKERNSELEGKIDGLLSKIDRDSAIHKSREVELASTSGSHVSWATAATVAASTGAIAMAVTAFYLRHGSQR